MFGDILFGMIPFAVVADEETPEAYVQRWINVCPHENTWFEQDKNIISTQKCKD